MSRRSFMQYAHWNVIPEVGVLPYVELPDDWETLLPQFHEGGGRRTIEEYVEALQGTLNQFNFGGSIMDEARWNIRLTWDDETSLLTNIGTSTAGGLDLERSGRRGHYSTHNLAVDNAIVAGIVAQEFVWELLKRRKDESE